MKKVSIVYLISEEEIVTSAFLELPQSNEVLVKCEKSISLDPTMFESYSLSSSAETCLVKESGGYMSLLCQWKCVLLAMAGIGGFEIVLPKMCYSLGVRSSKKESDLFLGSAGIYCHTSFGLIRGK